MTSSLRMSLILTARRVGELVVAGDEVVFLIGDVGEGDVKDLRVVGAVDEDDNMGGDTSLDWNAMGRGRARKTRMISLFFE
jgi:hypothetical protein